MSASMKKIFKVEPTPPLSGEDESQKEVPKSKKQRLTLVEPQLPPYFVSQFEKNPKGWIWDIVLGLYVLAIIGIVIFIEFKS